MNNNNAPRNFPPLILHNCVINNIELEFGEHINAIVSDSGAAYEIIAVHREGEFPEIGTIVYCGYLLVRFRNIYRRTSTIVAIKRYVIANMPGGNNYIVRIEDPIKAMAAMQSIKVPGCSKIMNCFEVTRDLEYCYCIMPFIQDGDLLDYAIVRETVRRSLTESEAYQYFKQILSGVRYLHQRLIAHLALSLENILRTSTGEIKIIGFGFCLLLPFQIDNNNAIQVLPVVSQELRGRYDYMAPEFFLNFQPFNGLQSDIWSLGVILFVLLCGQMPFPGANAFNRQLHYRQYFSQNNAVDTLLGAGQPIFRLVQLSPDAIDLLDRILRVNPDDRFTLDQIERHPWMTDHALNQDLQAFGLT